MSSEKISDVTRIDDGDLDADPPRISTGAASADRILGGGFPAHSINIIMGEPGTGKTLFAQQLVFHNAGGERPILYVTTLSEPLGKVVKYLQKFSFFDERLMGTSVIYEEAGTELAEKGIDALVPMVTDWIGRFSPKIIVIDSFKALHDLSPGMADMRRVVHDLAGLLTAYDTTAFLVGEYADVQMATHPEFVVADGIVELLRQETGMRDDRFFRVRKLRGSSYREGLHALQLTAGGARIFRRLVTPEKPQEYRVQRERVSTGVAGLDEMLAGGLWRGSTTLLGGPTGSGKTTIALQFTMEGVRSGEPSLYVHLEENPTQLEFLVEGFGMDAHTPGLHLLYHSPVELQIDSLVDEMFALIRSKRVKRIVIDAVGDLITAARDPQRLHDYLYALSQHFAVNGVTAIMTFETARQGLTGGYRIDAPFSHLSDNILLLEANLDEDRTHRKLRVIKTRGSSHDPRVREVEISGSGIHVV